MKNPAAPTRLRGAGLWVTKQRLAVLDVLDRAQSGHEHLTVAVIAERARSQLGSMSTQTVYDCVDALTKAGLLRAIEPAGHPTRSEARVDDCHHHLVCRGCGHIADVAGVLGADPCLAPSAASGFLIEATEVTFWGFCPSCTPQPAPVSIHREVHQ
jgi:Fe2+ or Zn2+ uptake regulation protein